MTQPADTSSSGVEKFVPEYKPPVPTEEELRKADDSSREEKPEAKR